jgi:predicted NBD/HSP70 family sugar kinase
VKAARTLVVDIGGSNVKCLLSGLPGGPAEKRKFDSDAKMTPKRMVKGVRAAAKGWHFDRMTIGYPGVVRHGVVVREPHNLGCGWVGFDFSAAFGCPVHVINDAAMQALGSYRGGKLLFLGLGTGLGSALIADGMVLALELGHLHWTKKHSYEEVVGKAGYARLGKKKWRHKVQRVVQDFSDALLPDDIVLGGGQSKKLKQLPAQARRGSNDDAFAGGFRVWEDDSLRLT